MLISLNFNSFAQTLILKLHDNCPDGKSQFSKIRTLDNREPGQILGYIEKDLGKSMGQIKFEGELADSLGKLFLNRSASTNGDWELVLILNEFFMHQVKGNLKNAAKFKFSFRMFSQVEKDRYVELPAIDSIYFIKSRKLIPRLAELINEELCRVAGYTTYYHRTVPKNSLSYSFHDLLKLDSLEKSSLPMYVDPTPKAGIYKDYAHFKANTPDINSEITIKKAKSGQVVIYRHYKHKNRKKVLDHHGIYAVSDGKILYKATNDGFHPMERSGLDFYYVRKGSFVDVGQGATEAAMWAMGGVFLWLIQSGINDSMSGPNARLYRFKIGHRRGNSVPVAMIGSR